LPSVDPAEAAKLASNSAESYTILKAPLPRIFGVFFNQSQNPVLADANVRKALDMATDRTAIVRSVLYGYGTAAHGPLPASLAQDLGISLDPSVDTADISDAQALLEKNGWKKDADGIYEKKSSKVKTAPAILSFDIYTADSPDLVATANMLKAQWSALGAQVDIQTFEQADLYQNVIRTRKYDALLFGEQIGKDRDLYAFWQSSQRNAPGLNVSMYANSKVDAILSDIRSSTSASAEKADYIKLDSAIRADIPAIFLYSPDFIYAVPKAFKGISLSSVTVPSDRWSSIGAWYIDTEKIWRIFAKNNN
jgi:peptide/nickel transport system substrate-binding protein